jgi:predicted ATP-grasp superfamily ATP-dependent carboligase
MKNKAVILGNNYYIGLSAVRSLGAEGVHTVAVDYSDEEVYSKRSKYCNESFVVPHYEKETDKFIEALIDYAKEQEAKPLLLPCHDNYVEVIDQHLDELKEYYLIPQQEQGLYQTVMNKDTLQELAIKHGVKTPESVHIDDDNFEEKVKNTIKFPCIVKPVDSPAFVEKFRKKIFKVHNMKQLKKAVNMANEAELEVIVQRIIPGLDDHMYTFDAYLNQDSKVTHWVTCQKLRQYPVNFGASVYTIQRYVPELYEIGAKFLEDIHYKGFAEIEFKKDAVTGDYYLIEINARMTNFNQMLTDLGFNFPYITYRELTGNPLPEAGLTESTNRAFWYVFEDLLAMKDYKKTKQLSLRKMITSLLRPKTYSYWNAKDPKPAIYYGQQMVSKIFKRLS